MSKRTKIPIVHTMISSRCTTEIKKRDGTTVKLTSLREAIKSELEQQQIFGTPLSQVWINENINTVSKLKPSTEVCLERVRSSDVVVVIYSGAAGWVPQGGTLGICQLELKEAYEHSPDKVIFVQLNHSYFAENPTAADRTFREYVERHGFFRGGQNAMTFEDVVDQVRREFPGKLKDVLGLGRQINASQQIVLGEKLEWSKLELRNRSEKMVGALSQCFQTFEHHGKSFPILDIEERKVQIILHAIPDQWSVAKGIIGNLRDEELNVTDELGRPVLCGPVHIVACYNKVTAAQARGLIGRTDCPVVQTKFGIYIADKYTGVQFIILNECRDRTSISAQVQNANEWIQNLDVRSDIHRTAHKRSELIVAISRIEFAFDQKPKKAS
jgi:hypothetical protein